MMWKNYLKISLRSILKNKKTSLINVFGTISITLRFLDRNPYGCEPCTETRHIPLHCRGNIVHLGWGYEKKGKNQHAFCTDIDNEGDVRVLVNIKPNEYWMNTMLHEYGHAAYDKYIDNKNLPWALREPAHTFVTEAVAQLFGRFSSNPKWLMEVVKISKDEAKDILRKHNVTFVSDGCVTLETEKIITAQGPAFAKDFGNAIAMILG